MDTIGVSQTDFLSGEISMTFDLEKNRAAIDSAINSLLCEGWDNEASTVRRLVAEIERLRAIIDTPSEEPEWVVDFKKLNRFAGAGYSLIDIEIAKKWHTAYRKAQNSNLLRKQEIERLRKALDESERVVAHKTKSAAHWYDEHLQARADRVQTRRVVEQQAARIKELEDAHKRSGKKYAKIINELRSSVYANIPGLDVGKIGPDAAKPRSWQITEERKAATRDAEIALRDAVLDSNDLHCWDAETAVLRGMLEEVA